MQSKLFIRLVLFLLLPLSVSGQQDPSKNNSCDLKNLTGKWILFSFKSGAIQKTDADKYIAKLPRLPTNPTGTDSLIFNSDSTCYFANDKKYSFDLKGCTLSTFDDGKLSLSYTIVRLDNFLVITNCTLDCMTEFYIKQQ